MPPSGWPENDGVPLNDRHPRAISICDYCGRAWHRDELILQREYAGMGLISLGFLVGRCCLDKPQAQLKSLVLPPDPVPVVNPRPENYQLDSGLQGFSQNVVVTPPQSPVLVYSQVIALGTSQGWANPVPGGITDGSTTLANGFQSVQVLPANPARVYLLIYNPTTFEIGVSQTVPASFTADQTTTLIGGGTALLQSASLGQTVWLGAVNLIGSFNQIPVVIASA